MRGQQFTDPHPSPLIAFVMSLLDSEGQQTDAAHHRDPGHRACNEDRDPDFRIRALSVGDAAGTQLSPEAGHNVCEMETRLKVFQLPDGAPETRCSDGMCCLFAHICSKDRRCACGSGQHLGDEPLGIRHLSPTYSRSRRRGAGWRAGEVWHEAGEWPIAEAKISLNEPQRPQRSQRKTTQEKSKSLTRG